MKYIISTLSIAIFIMYYFFMNRHMKRTDGRPFNIAILLFLILFMCALAGFIFLGTRVYLIRIILGYICVFGAIAMVLFNTRLVYRKTLYAHGPSQLPIITTILLLLSYIFLPGHNHKLTFGYIRGIILLAVIIDIGLPILLSFSLNLIKRTSKKHKQ